MRAILVGLALLLSGSLSMATAQQMQQPIGARPVERPRPSGTLPAIRAADVAVLSLDVYYIGTAPAVNRYAADTVMLVAKTQNIGNVSVKGVLQCLTIEWENCMSSDISDYAPGETRTLVGFTEFRHKAPGKDVNTPRFHAWVGAPGFYTGGRIDHHPDDANAKNDHKEFVTSELALHHGRQRLASPASIAGLDVTAVDRKAMTSRVQVRLSNRGPETVRNLRLTLLGHGGGVLKQWGPIGLGRGAGESMSYLDSMHHTDECMYWAVLNADGPDSNPIDVRHGECKF